MTPDVQAIVAEAWSCGWTVSVVTPQILAMTKGDRVLAVAIDEGVGISAAATDKGCIHGPRMLGQILTEIREEHDD
jgi:hypothetical protein